MARTITETKSVILKFADFTIRNSKSNSIHSENDIIEALVTRDRMNFSSYSIIFNSCIHLRQWSLHSDIVFQPVNLFIIIDDINLIRDFRKQ